MQSSYKSIIKEPINVKDADYDYTQIISPPKIRLVEPVRKEDFSGNPYATTYPNRIHISYEHEDFYFIGFLLDETGFLNIICSGTFKNNLLRLTMNLQLLDKTLYYVSHKDENFKSNPNKYYFMLDIKNIVENNLHKFQNWLNEQF